ncbi:hypothetical protein ebA322 [Aromatoleum aromaticum EbN1]|uniref:Uncharacterized protein n=1 Tax=Aromatoleum aromaticum (strain DSM 19018 / LMG 30748 / EbN1) TaxID=76114 RepID=Q5P8R8_AROAE|nr:hypothetical protein ebA322 [Aromatoleum aromaticum EbN1]
MLQSSIFYPSNSIVYRKVPHPEMLHCAIRLVSLHWHPSCSAQYRTIQTRTMKASEKTNFV